MHRIIVMKDGEISEIGSYEELLKRNGSFAEFLKEFINENEPSGSDGVYMDCFMATQQVYDYYLATLRQLLGRNATVNW